MKIYTKTGDDGTTGLFSGRRVGKDSSFIDAYGTVDELNAWLGYCASGCSIPEVKTKLIEVQNALHSVCADLATPAEAGDRVDRFLAQPSVHLERWIDEWQSQLAPLKQFILAGGTELASRLHIARTVCRRAERLCVAHSRVENVNPNIVIYLNRLSDWLFVCARFANFKDGLPDQFWNPRSAH